MSIIGIFLFVVILLALVIIHELGHFLVAKWTGMRVDEFAFGFPPRIFAKKKGETTYAINAIPLGGYVSIYGETGEPDDAAVKDPRAFGNRPWWAQILTLLAGVTMNMLLAWCIFVIGSYGSVQMSVSDPVYGARVEHGFLTVVDAVPESPAYRAGIIPGSIITAVTSNGSKATLTSATSAIAFVSLHQHDALQITYQHPDGYVASTTIAAVYGIVPDKKAIGLSLDIQGIVTTTPWEALKLGSQVTWFVTRSTFDGLMGMITSLGDGANLIKELSGPIGIAKIVGERSEFGFGAVMNLVAVLSINLAVLNSIPFPALDGGRIIIVIVEAITRRKMPIRWLMHSNALGFFLLILLLVAVTVKDIFY